MQIYKNPFLLFPEKGIFDLKERNTLVVFLKKPLTFGLTDHAESFVEADAIQKGFVGIE